MMQKGILAIQILFGWLNFRLLTIRFWSWLSKSYGEEGPAAFGDLNLCPDTEVLANQQFQIDFALSGQEQHKAGSIELVFPANIWENIYEAEYGTLALSVPEDPESSAEFAWK